MARKIFRSHLSPLPIPLPITTFPQRSRFIASLILYNLNQQTKHVLPSPAPAPPGNRANAIGSGP
jgi:hypothetical protein